MKRALATENMQRRKGAFISKKKKKKGKENIFSTQKK